MLRHPLVSVVLTLGLTAVGMFGSAQILMLASRPPFSWLPAGYEGWLYWGSLAALSLMLFGRQYSIDNDRSRSIERFERLLEQMPPEGFLEQAVAIHGDLELLCRRLPEARSRQVVQEWIQTALQSILLLAVEFDKRPCRCAANVMLFRDDDSDGLPNVQIVFNDVQPESRLGVLEIHTDLSVARLEDGESVSPDPELVQIALPVPSELQRRSRYLALPGAPMAFLTGEMVAFKDTREMAQFCREHGNFTPDTIDQVEEYFRTHEEIGSLMSIPISVPDIAPDEDVVMDRVIGVLNLHSSARGFLIEGLKPELFHLAIKPITSQVVRLIDFCQSMADGEVASPGGEG